MSLTNNLWGIGTSGLGSAAVFVLTRNTDGEFWNAATPGYEVYNAAHIANYGLAATETGVGTGIYSAANPDTNLYAARCLLINKAGASLAQTDLSLGLQWEEQTGYLLAFNGIDLVVVEIGLNARQSLSIIGSSAAGILSGAPGPTITMDGMSNATGRISASVDGNGNRTAVTLTPPV